MPTMPSTSGEDRPEVGDNVKRYLSRATIDLEILGASVGFNHPRRTIVLDETQPTLVFGRASKVESKGIAPTVGNGWFDCPIMSRRHAELSFDIPKRAVFLTDLSSRHGTYVDQSRLVPGVPFSLFDGAQLRFGVQVVHSSQCFPPCLVSLKTIQWAGPSPEPSLITYRLPEESDDEVSEESSDSDSQDDVDAEQRVGHEPSQPQTLIKKDVHSGPSDPSRASLPPSPLPSRICDKTLPPDSIETIAAAFCPSLNAAPVPTNTTTNTTTMPLNIPTSSHTACDDGLDDDEDMPHFAQEGTYPEDDDLSDDFSDDLDNDMSDDVDEDMQDDLDQRPKEKPLILGFSPYSGFSDSESHGEYDSSADDSNGLDYSDADIDYVSEDEIFHEGRGQLAGGITTHHDDDEEDTDYSDDDDDDDAAIDAEEEASVAQVPFTFDHGLHQHQAVSRSTASAPATAFPPQPPPFTASVTPMVETHKVESANQRQASPSDAAMPKSVRTRCSRRDGAIALAEKTGKHDFFEAREVNRQFVESRNENSPTVKLPSLNAYYNPAPPIILAVPSAPRVSTACTFSSIHSVIESPQVVSPWGGRVHIPANQQPAGSNEQYDGQSAPRDLEGRLALQAEETKKGVSESLKRLEDFKAFIKSRHSGQQTQKQEAQKKDLQHHEPQQQEQQEQDPVAASSSRRTHVGINELVDTDYPTVPEPTHLFPPLIKFVEAANKVNAELRPEALPAEPAQEDAQMVDSSEPELEPEPETAQVPDVTVVEPKDDTSKTPTPKRKREDISVETEQDRAWDLRSTGGGVEKSSNVVEETTVSPNVPAGVGRETQTETPAIIAPKEDSDERPAKRRRNVAEMMGMATLGALSAGVTIFAALVATAPEFN